MFADDPSTCHRCGHDQRDERVSASTWRLAIAIAEVVTGKRQLSGREHGRTTHDEKTKT